MSAWLYLCSFIICRYICLKCVSQEGNYRRARKLDTRLGVVVCARCRRRSPNRQYRPLYCQRYRITRIHCLPPTKCRLVRILILDYYWPDSSQRIGMIILRIKKNVLLMNIYNGRMTCQSIASLYSMPVLGSLL